MSEFTKVRFVKAARKPHYCHECEKNIIEKGDSYYRTTGVDYDLCGFITWNECKPCHDTRIN